MIKYKINIYRSIFHYRHSYVGFFTARYDGAAQSNGFNKYWEAGLFSSLHEIRGRNQNISARLNKDII